MDKELGIIIDFSIQKGGFLQSPATTIIYKTGKDKQKIITENCDFESLRIGKILWVSLSPFQLGLDRYYAK